MIVAAVSGAFVAVEVVRAKGSFASLRRAALWGALFAVPFAIYFGWRWSYYGYLLPNTFYAKVGGTTAIYSRGLDYVSTYGLRYQVLLMFVGSAFLFTKERLRADVSYVFALTGALLTAIVIEGADDFPNGRFMAPLLPLVYLAGLCGFAIALKQLSLDRLRTAAVAGTALVLGGLSLLPGSATPALELERRAHDQRQALGEWLNQETPEDFRIAAYAVGAIGYYADDRAIVDLLGLNDETIAHTDVPNLGEGIAGHEKYNPDYVYNVVRPEIFLPNDAQPGPMTTEELRTASARPSLPARDSYLIDARLWTMYEVRSYEIEGFWFNILVRKDVLDRLPPPSPS
jgi:hypothetical protein